MHSAGSCANGRCQAGSKTWPMMWTVAFAVCTSMHTASAPFTVRTPLLLPMVSAPPLTVITLPAAMRSAELIAWPATTW